MPNFDICYAIKIHRTKQTKGSDDDVFWNRHNGSNYGAAIRSSFDDYDLTFMGVVNIGLGAFFVFTYLTQTRSEPDKRKKKKKRD